MSPKDAQKENLLFHFSNALCPQTEHCFPHPHPTHPSSASKEKSSIPPRQNDPAASMKETISRDEIAR